MGLLERHDKEAEKPSKVKASVVPSRKRRHVSGEVRDHVQPGSQVFTDALLSYADLSKDYAHEFIDHAEKYVEGQVHTNGLENFWSLLKRSIKGTYVSVDPAHLKSYLDEQVFRFNERGGKDGDRFLLTLTQVEGRRLTYKKLIGVQVG